MGHFYNPPPHIVSATGAQPNAPDKLPPSITAVAVDNPVPNADAAVNLTTAIGWWQADNSLTSELPWPFQPFMGESQPLMARQLPPIISGIQISSLIPNRDYLDNLYSLLALWREPDPLPTQRVMRAALPGWSVNNPPPNADAASNINSILAGTWQPPDPLPTLRIKSILPGWSVDNPVPNADALINLGTVQTTWIPPDPLPAYKPKPILPGWSVDQPVVNVDFLSNLNSLLATAWQSPDPLPTLTLKSVLPGWSVDNPPGFKPFVPFSVPLDPLPQRGALTPQTTAAPSASIVYTTPWLPLILLSWQPNDPLPTLPRVLVQAPGTSVDLPPGAQRLVPLALPDDFLPQLPSKLPPDVLNIRVDNPPFGTFYGSLGTQLNYAWLPADPLPTLTAKFIFGVQTDNPPFTHFGRSVIQAYQTNYAWQPPDPLPTLKITSVFAVQIDNPPFSHQGRSVVQAYQTNYAWQPPDPLPTLAEKLTPPSTDNPPFTHSSKTVQFNQTLVAWRDPDPQPVQRGPLAPSITAVKVDLPPPNATFWANYANLLTIVWQPPDPLPSLGIKYAVSQIPPPPPVTELPHGLPFLYTVGQLRSF